MSISRVHKFPACLWAIVLLASGYLAGTAMSADDSKPNGDKIFKLSGQVIDADGKGVSGAKVILGSRSLKTRTSFLADEQGNFSLELNENDPQTKSSQLWATSPDGALLGFYRPQYPGDSPKADEAKIKIEATKAAKVQIVDAKGAAIENANVAFQFQNSVAIGPFHSDSNGLVSVLIPGTDRLESVIAWKDDVGFDYRAYSLPRNNAQAVNAKVPEFPLASGETLKLDGAAPLKVRVVDGQSQPVPGVDLYVWLLNKSDDEDRLNLSFYHGILNQTSDSNGQTIFAWFPVWQKNVITVWPRIEGYTHKRGNYEPSVGDRQVEIHIEKLIPLRGKVTLPDGAPAVGINVAAAGAGHSMDRFHGGGKTDDAGRYEILVDPDQIYMLYIQDKQWAAPTQSGFAVFPNQSVADHDFRVQSATRLHGQLLDKTTGEPVPGKLIYLTQEGIDLNTMGKDLLPNPERTTYWVAPLQQYNLVTDENGAYEFFVGPGKYNLFMQGVEGEKVLVQDEKEIVSNLSILQKKQIELTGSVVDDKTSKPIASAKISSVSVSRRDFSDWTAVADEAGQFKVKRLAEPTVTRVLNADNSLGAVVHIAPDDATVQIALRPLGSAAGRLMSHDGSVPAAKVKLRFGIRISDKESGMSSDRFGGLLTTDANGYFTMENLVPGAMYRCVLADHPGGFVLEVASATVEPGQTMDLGELKTPETPKPYVPPTLEERIRDAFNVAGTPQERFDKAAKLIDLVNQNLVILFGNPTDPRVHALMKLRFEDESYRPYADDFRMLAIPTDGDRLTTAQELAKRFAVELSDGREAFHLLVVNHAGELVASAGIKQLCNDDMFSKETLIALLDQHRTQVLDARKLLDDALAQAARENKRVLVQETATWCGPCHMLSRWLGANRQWEQDYVWIKIDHRWTGATEIMAKLRDGAGGGIPWCVILDSSGNKLTTSNLPDGGDNTGFPSEASGQVHFTNMLKSTRIRMTDTEINALVSAATSTQ